MIADSPIKKRARQFVIDNYVNPSPQDFLLIENAMLIGMSMTVERDMVTTCLAHEVAEIPGDYYAKDKWRSDSARCKHCSCTLGWYCPSSPDHLCHYEISGDPDECDFCGMPDERK